MLVVHIVCLRTHHGRWPLVCQTDLHRVGRGIDRFVAIIVLSQYTMNGRSNYK